MKDEGLMREIAVRLEPLSPDHAPEMLEGLRDVEAYRFLPSDPPTDLAELTARYERQAVGRSPDGSQVWLNWIVSDAVTGAAMGYTQATIQGRSALLGYHVFPAFWRTGVGRAAVSASLSILFARPDVDRAWALIDTRNVASISLLRRLGFSVVRRHENADFFKGASSDEVEMEITRQDGSQTSPARE